MQIISDILNSNTGFLENFGRNNEHIKEAETNILTAYEKLHNILSKEQIEILTNYAECHDKYELLLIDEAFCHGFSIAIKIITEALLSK